LQIISLDFTWLKCYEFFNILEVKLPKSIVRDLLQDSNKCVQLSAIGHISGFNMEEFAGDLVRFLKDPDLADHAAFPLGEIAKGDRSVISSVIKLLDEEDPMIRSSAVSALASMRVKGSIERLKELLLYDDDESVRENVAQALGTLDARELTKEISKLLEDSKTIKGAVLGLAEMGVEKKKVAKRLIIMAKDTTRSAIEHCYPLYLLTRVTLHFHKVPHQS
jgi:HEAT repeat protein